MYYLKTPLFQISEGEYSSMLDDCFQLRYKTYCVEKQWLCEDGYKDKLETDEYDSSAKHVVIRDNTKLLKGYSRLIISDDLNKMPMKSYPGIKELIGENNILKAEVSRFVSNDNSLTRAISIILIRKMDQIARKNIFPLPILL